MSFRGLTLALFILTGSLRAGAQDSTAALVKKMESWRSHELQEKIYAHLDRSFYLTGETAWFSLYYTDASFNRPLDISKVAYVEIINKENAAVAQVKIELARGGGYGSVFLPASIASGNYSFRAYTSWMKNFSADAFYQQAITIINPFTKLGLPDPPEQPAYDAQFFPEGGVLVAGLPARVAFRVADNKGNGIHFRGGIVTESNDTIVRFGPRQLGIGSFDFLPAASHVYTAVISDIKGHVTKVSLPRAASTGYVVRVTDTVNNALRISVRSATAAGNNGFCYVLIHTRATRIAARMLVLSGGKGSFVVDRSKLGDGVSHITVFDPSLQPVCERLYFKQPPSFSLNVHADQPSYDRRKKITLSVAGGTAASVKMSVSVYRADSLETETSADIKSFFWLTSELKGTVESPGFYFSRSAEENQKALDDVMLTYGWSRYRWDEIMAKQPRLLEFTPEYSGHIVLGQIKNVIPVNQHKVTAYLSNPDKNIRLYPSRSTFGGKIQFELRQFYGLRKLIVQTDTRLDSIYDLEISAPFSKNFSASKLPEFTFSTAAANSLANRSLHMQVQNTFHDFKNDRITAPKIDTTAFYGKSDQKFFLDDYTRFPTMEEVMREYITGVRVRKRRGTFHFGVLDNLNHLIFQDNPLVLLDGVPVFSINKIIAMDPLKVKKIEVMTRKYYLGPLAFDGIVSYTTYRGDMAGFEIDKRALILDYEGLQQYREFFSPVYDADVQKNNRIPDVRTLLYWNPSVNTDHSGTATVSFYTSDVPGSFKIVVQALSADGVPGTGAATFIVQ